MSCPFCAIATGEVRASIVWRGEQICAFLDRSPLFRGHVLVVPRAHVVALADLPADLVAPYFAVVQQISRAVEHGLGAGGTFLAINNGVSQSVPHLHTHVVPRTKGDGLRGFFWPREKYADEAEADRYAAQIAAALGR